MELLGMPDERLSQASFSHTNAILVDIKARQKLYLNNT
jgi:hypothetical protein